MSEPNVPPAKKVTVEIELEDSTLVQYTFDQPVQVAIEMKEPDPFARTILDNRFLSDRADFIFSVLDIPKSFVKTKFISPEEREDI